MPIVIKELFPSDPLSEALEKINFNFDQLILAGGGPPGPLGPQGVPGIPGPQGERGDHWQVGTTAPTADHGPNYGALKDYDFWISATGQVYYWSIGSTSWVNSGTNLTGPQGASGATGGSFEMGMYQGSTGNANTPFSIPPVGPTNYTPGIGGATTVASGGVDFIIPVNIDKNSFFLGDKSWAYTKLNNFGVYDVSFPGNIQRLTPKQVIIQTGIDWTGLGGLTIGAYGATSTIGSPLSSYQGDNTLVTNALNFFTAGFAFRQVGPNYAHLFRMRTGTIDLEIQAGDNNYTELSAGKTPDLILRSNRTLISDFGSAQITIGATSTMFREKVAIGYSILPTFDAGSTLDNFGKGRSRGDFYIGALNGLTNSLGIGYGRTVDGVANISLYTDGLTPTIETFSIFRTSGPNGVGRIAQYGSGLFEFNHLGTGDIKFSTTASNQERMRITTGGNVGIGTPTPNTKLEVSGDIHVSGGDRTIFNRSNNSLAFGTSNTERVRITAGGTVGIGTTTPTDLLEIGNGNIAINDSALAVQGIGRGIKFENGTSVASSINLYRGSSTNNVGLSFVNSNAGATSEAMRIHPSGVISIGNSSAHLTTPTVYRVHIQDNTSHSLLIRSNDSISGSRNNILFQKQNGTSVTSTTSFLGGLSFGGWDGTNWSVGSDGGAEILAGVPFSWTPTSKPAHLTFNTTPNLTNVSVERMRISSEGKISIGTQGNATLDLEFQNNANKTIGLNTAAGNGFDLNIRSGVGAGADRDGGDLSLYMGQSTGAGTAFINFYGLDTTSIGGSIPATYELKAFMDRGGRWSFGHSGAPTSIIDISGDIRFRNNSTNNTILGNGLRFNSDNDTYESEIRPYQGTDNTKMGLSFLTSNTNSNSVERMRINPDGGIDMIDDIVVNSATGVVNGGTAGTAVSPVVFFSFVSNPNDRLVYISTGNAQQFSNSFIASGRLYIRYEMTNGVTSVALKEIWSEGANQSFIGNFSHSFILPAGWVFNAQYYKLNLVIGSPFSITANTIGIGKK